MSKTNIIKIMTVMTIIAAVFGTISGITLMANASWTNILSTVCTLVCAFIAMIQLLLVKEAYRGFVDPDEEE